MKQEKDDSVSGIPFDQNEKEKAFIEAEELPAGPESVSRSRERKERDTRAARIDRTQADRDSSVEVLQDVIGLITAPEVAPEAGKKAEAQRELNEVVHSMLVIGVAVSAAVMCVGITLSLIFHTPLPSRVSNLKQVIEGLDRLAPSSYLSLGILLLIGTPILRVFGSMIEFVITGDWRYAAVSLLVLIVLSASILVGSG